MEKQGMKSSEPGKVVTAVEDSLTTQHMTGTESGKRRQAPGKAEA